MIQLVKWTIPHCTVFSVILGLTSPLSWTSFDSLEDTDDSRGSSLRYVYAFFRHGIRYPLCEPYPTDKNKAEYGRLFPAPGGQLTQAGKQQMYNVGKKLKSLYGRFVGEYCDSKVYVSSTDRTRTMMSALATVAGFFPPPKPILEDLNWQPIPVWQGTKDFDKAYIYYEPNFAEHGLKVCPMYGRLLQKAYDKLMEKDTNPGRKKLYQLLQQFTGNPNVNSIKCHYAIWDTLQFESLNGLPLPRWATVPQPSLGRRPLFPDLMEPLTQQWFQDAIYLDYDKEMLSFYSGPLYNSIHEHFQMKVKQPGLSEVMRLHSTHDTTLFTLVSALNVTEYVPYGPGDGVLYELHNVDNNYIVKVLYMDSNRNFSVKELMLPSCPSPCPLYKFMELTPVLTPQQWEAKCKQ